MGFGGFVSLCSITYTIEAASMPYPHASMETLSWKDMPCSIEDFPNMSTGIELFSRFAVLFCVSGMSLKQSVNGHHQGKASCVHGGCNVNLQLDTSQVVAVACRTWCLHQHCKSACEICTRHHFCIGLPRRMGCSSRRCSAMHQKMR